MHPVSTNRKRLLIAVAVGAFALNGGSGAIGAGVAFAASSGSATIHFSNASARSNACKANNLQAIFITVSEVDGHRSGKKGGWTTLAKPSAPVQLNLLDENAPEPDETPFSGDGCMLASMGSNGGLPAGKYQQLRIIVDTDPNTPPSSNACSSLGAGVFNCVQLTDNSFHALTVPSGSKTGIKIPSTKIHKGGLVITDGQGADLDIDINACRSIVVTGGHGKKKPPHGGGSASYKLKPVLQAGEASLSSVISGQVVLGTVGNNGAVTPDSPTVPMPFASLWLEETSNGVQTFVVGDPAATANNLTINGIAAETQTDANGNFVFCPVPTASDYELVVNPLASNSLPNPTDVTITTGITASANGGMSGLVVPVVEPPSAPTAAAQYATQDGSNPAKPFAEALDLGMTQSDGTHNAPFEFFNHSSVSPTTTAASTQQCQCPAGFDCSCVNLQVPVDNPVVGPAGDGSGYSTSGSAEFSLLAEGTTSSGPGSCSVANRLATVSSSSVTTPTLEFQGCQ